MGIGEKERGVAIKFLVSRLFDGETLKCSSPKQDFKRPGNAMDIRQFILPGGAGLTHIKVYDTPGPDGAISGGAHIHLVCSEIYFVLKGTGQMELLSIDGLETVDLVPNKVVFFRPGTFHRVLNPNKDLEILAIMQNGGLPERGDFVMSFPPEVLGNVSTYAQALRARASSADGGADECSGRGAVGVVSGGDPERHSGIADHAPGAAGGLGRAGGGGHRG